MAGKQTSTEFSNGIEDVMPVFRSLIAKAPAVAGMIPIAESEDRFAKNHVHKWLEYKKSQTTWTVNGNSATSSTALVLDSTTGVKAGDILQFEKPSGASTSVKAKVVSVTNGTDLVIERLFSTDEIILDNSIVTLVSRAKAENSTEDLENNAEPTKKTNYTQIFRRDFILSRTTLQTAFHGLATDADRERKVMDMVDFQVQNQLSDILFEYNNSLIDGYPEQRVAGGDNGTFRGMIPHLQLAAASQLDGGAVAITPTILNNAVEQAVGNGAKGTDLTRIICNSNQARKLTAFNQTGNNPVIERGDVTAGSYVARFQSDLAGTNGGALVEIVVDRNFPKDMMVITNPSSHLVAPMQPFFIEETTDNKTDGRTWKLLGELTYEFHNANDESILIHNLAV